MKKNLLLTLLLCCSAALFAGDGSISSPFSVREAKAHAAGSQTYYVKGYVVGALSAFSNNKYFYNVAPPFDQDPNYLLADDVTEFDLDKCIPIQFKGSMADTLMLDAHPQYWRKQVIACGRIGDFFALKGLVSLTDLRFLSQPPYTDETSAWTFFEDFNEKNGYTPNNTSLVFSGGVYAGETGEWSFTGSTWGDSSNDSKWDKASARLRLTEGPTGDRGHIEMSFDKSKGIGTVRFWAGHFGTDRGGKLSLSLSADKGMHWETVVSEIAVSNKWQEYQVEINRDGDLRLRIGKAEDTGAGINVDNVHISDFRQLSDVKNEETATVKVWGSEGALRIETNSGACVPVTLYTVSGVEVLRKSVCGSTTWPIEPGLYLVSVSGRIDKVIIR